MEIIHTRLYGFTTDNSDQRQILTEKQIQTKDKLDPKTNSDQKPDSDQRQILTEKQIQTKDKLDPKTNSDKKPDSDQIQIRTEF